VAIRELIAEFFTRADTKPLERADGFMDRLKGKTPPVGAAVDGLVGKIQALGTLFAGSALVGAVVSFTEAFVSQADALRVSAGAIGVTTDAYQALSLAFDGSERLGRALERLQLATTAAASGTGAAGAAFHTLGVRAKDAHGQIRPMGEVLPEVMDGFQRIADPVRRAALAHQLFGRASGELLPFLSQGRAGLAAARAELERLGGGVSARAIEAARNLGDEQLRLNVATDSLKSTLAEQLLPTLTRGVGKMIDLMAGVRRLLAGSNALKHGLELLKVVLAGVAIEMAIANLPLIAAVAGFAALALAYDDFRTMMEGGNSVIGRAIDSLFGAGHSTALVQRLHDLWADTLYLMRQVREFANTAQPTAGGSVTPIQAGAQGARNVAGLVQGGEGRQHALAQETASARGVLATWGDWIRHPSHILHPSMALAQGAASVVPRPGGSTSSTTNAPTAVHLAPTTVNVTVPPGTDATTAARAGRAVAEAMDAHTDQQVRALQGALIQRTTGGTP